jgi:16S rRNA (uracil1498-N3)-methyltransferase
VARRASVRRDGQPAEAVADVSAAPRRFFLADLPAGDELELRGGLAHRLARVLRLPVGTPVDLFDGLGNSRSARIAAVRGGAVTLTFTAPAILHNQEPVTTLCAALIRPNRFEWLIEKATELGATMIQPLLSHRAGVRPDEISAPRLARWHRIAVEAAEQSGRVTVPDLRPPQPFASALDHGRARRFIAVEPSHGVAPPLGSLLAGISTGPVTLITGPEGGFTSDELRAAATAGVQPVSLGPHTLRAETAAIAGLAVLSGARAGVRC